MRSVVHATLRSVNEDPLTIDPDLFSVQCWKKEGSRGCDDYKGGGARDFTFVITAAINRAVDYLARPGLPPGRGGPSLAQLKETVRASKVQVRTETGEHHYMTVSQLLAEVAVCARDKPDYVCKEENFVTEGFAAPVSTVEACGKAGEFRKTVEEQARRIAETRPCPRDDAKPTEETHCPDRELKAKVRWGLQLAVVTKTKGREPLSTAGAVVTVTVDCLRQPPSPVKTSRQPPDPVPPETGGGTPTPPEGGGGTPTPPGRRPTGLGSVLDSAHMRVSRE